MSGKMMNVWKLRNLMKYVSKNRSDRLSVTLRFLEQRLFSSSVFTIQNLMWFTETGCITSINCN